MPSELHVVNQQLRFPAVTLVEPTTSSYLHIAAEVDRRPPFLPISRAKRDLLARCKAWCAQLAGEAGVIDTAVFTAVLIPPIPKSALAGRRGAVHVARFDLVVLIECEDAGARARLQGRTAYRAMEDAIRAAASYVHCVTATNVRRIGPVDHTRPGVFLFNYFHSDNTDQNLAVWNYTAGWFQAETGLNNSTVLLPDDPRESQYAVINHCRWDRLRHVLPSLIFKKTFHSYVLDNFTANNVAPMPILYHLA